MNIEIILETTPNNNRELKSFLVDSEKRCKFKEDFLRIACRSIADIRISNDDIVNLGESLGLIIPTAQTLIDKLSIIREDKSDEEIERYIDINRYTGYNFRHQKNELYPAPTNCWRSPKGYIETPKEKKYHLWYIGCKLNGHYYGGMLVYVYPKYAFIESITKYNLFHLFHEAYPEIVFPSLNSILIPVLERELLKVNINIVYGAPVDVQRKILEGKHGFILCEKESLPERDKEKLAGTFSGIWLVKTF